MLQIRKKSSKIEDPVMDAPEAAKEQGLSATLVLQLGWSAKDGIIPEAPLTVLENTKMGSTLIKAMLQKDGGSVPEARESVASRLSGFYNYRGGSSVP